MRLPSAQVLGGIVGDAVAEGGEGSDHQAVELDGSGVARHDRRAEGVDDSLDCDIAHGNKALLEDAGNGNDSQTLQKRKGEYGNFLLCLNFPKPSQNHEKRQQAADSLAQEGGPGNTCHAHFEHRDK